MSDKFQAQSAVVAAGGSSYVAGDVLTVVGGTDTFTAQFQVASVDGGGAVITVILLAAGSYSVQPVNPASTSGGTGTLCTLTVTWISLRLDSEQADVLDAVVRQLVTNLRGFSEKTCFLSISPDPPFKVADNQFITVAPNAGEFPEEMQAGGGQHQATEMTGVQVTIFSRFQAYRPGRERDALSEWTRGILRTKRLILKALVAQDVTSGGADILRSLVMATQSSFPEYVKGEEFMIKIAVNFSISYDWNLTL